MLSKLLENNYKEILVIAKRITQRNPRKEAKELISEVYLFIHEKDMNFKNDKEFIFYFAKVMKFMYIGIRSNYNKNTKLSNCHLEYDPGNDDWKQIEIDAEGINQETKDMMSELSHLSIRDVTKYAELMDFKRTLPPHEKQLFEWYFEGGYSTRFISNILEKETGWGMSYVRFNEMINVLKSKITDQWN